MRRQGCGQASQVCSSSWAHRLPGALPCWPHFECGRRRDRRSPVGHPCCGAAAHRGARAAPPPSSPRRRASSLPDRCSGCDHVGRTAAGAAGHGRQRRRQQVEAPSALVCIACPRPVVLVLVLLVLMLPASAPTPFSSVHGPSLRLGPLRRPPSCRSRHRGVGHGRETVARGSLELARPPLVGQPGCRVLRGPRQRSIQPGRHELEGTALGAVPAAGTPVVLVLVAAVGRGLAGSWPPTAQGREGCGGSACSVPSTCGSVRWARRHGGGTWWRIGVGWRWRGSLIACRRCRLHGRWAQGEQLEHRAAVLVIVFGCTVLRPRDGVAHCVHLAGRQTDQAGDLHHDVGTRYALLTGCIKLTMGGLKPWGPGRSWAPNPVCRELSW